MRLFTRRNSLVGVAALSAAALTLAGCAADDNGGTTTTGSGDGGTSAAAGCDAYADFLGHEGSTVEIYTTIIEPESLVFQESFLEFEECTGITIEWNGDQAFEEQIAVRVAGGTAPDLAIFPQPGLMASFVNDMVPASAALEASVDANYSPDMKIYGTIDGTFYAPPLGSNVKSWVWHSPQVFAENGWDIPTTWDELLALSEEIAASDFEGTAWCAGIESGVATGWVVTDWMEDLMLRVHGVDVYDAWVDNSMPFNDERVLQVLNEAGKILKNPDFVGNVPAIATTNFFDGAAGLVDGTCAMHRQASFLGGVLVSDYGATLVSPEDTDVDGGVAVFYFPGVSTDSTPVLFAGEFMAAFSDDPAVDAVQRYLTSAEWNNAKAALGGWLSAHLSLDTNLIDDPVNKASVELLQDTSNPLRFDASDLMPGAVGAGSFWREMTAWIAEDKDGQTALDAIQATWP